MDNILKEYIEKLKSVDTVEEYEVFISNLNQMMKQESYKNDIIQNIRSFKGIYPWKYVKSKRKSTNFKKLIEEIEADIVHYKADNIFFYIYDKEKIIKDRHIFKISFNRSFDGKEVRVIILQPVNI